MSLSIQKQALYWGAVAVAFLALLWFLGGILTPFLVGSAFAYFLDPLADWLERRGFSRVMATTFITLGAVLCAVLIMVAVLPSFIWQGSRLVAAMPDIITHLQHGLVKEFPSLLSEDSLLRRSFTQLTQFLSQRESTLLSGVLNSALSLISWLVFILVVPVVTFYMLLDWDRMMGRIDALLPRAYAPVIRELAHEIDRVLAHFVRGQLSVCLVQAVYYSTALMLVGLDFGLVVGVIAGAITFIPYVGAIVGGMLAIGLGLFQFWGEWLNVGLVVGVFLVGQFVEGNILTPRLVGRSVGLHPIWLILALSAFGALFGFAGMLIAVPLAAVLGVLTRFAIARYTQSTLYLGSKPSPPAPVQKGPKPPVKREES